MARSDHPSSDRSGRFALDALIRSKGFKIHSREGGKEPVWFRDGELWYQSEIEDILDLEEMEAVREIEHRYRKQRYK